MKFYCEECFEEMGNCLADCKAAARDRARSKFFQAVAAIGAQEFPDARDLENASKDATRRSEGLK